jgi:hypothetical protein
MKLHANAAPVIDAAASDGVAGARAGLDCQGCRGGGRDQSENLWEVGGSLPDCREFGLLDRSSAPRQVANRTCERRIEAIAALRRLRFTGPEIAELLGMPPSTVSGILTRIGMGRLGRLGP